MQIVLGKRAAKEFGGALRLIRTTRRITLRDTAGKSGLSPQYINNIERGDRIHDKRTGETRPRAISQEAYERLASALEGPPPGVFADLLLRARIATALEERGLSAEQVAFVLKGVDQRLAEIGYPTTPLGDVLTDMLSPVTAAR